MHCSAPRSCRKVWNSGSGDELFGPLVVRRITASVVRGRYARYHCYQKDCPRYGQTIPRDQMHGEFERLLMSLTARPGFLKLVREITGDLWERRVREWDQEGRAQELQVRAAGEEISALVKRIGKTGDEELVREYEREVKELRAARERAERILKKHQEGPPNFEEALERVGTLLQSPYLIWKAGDRDVKRAVVERVFQTAPTYDRESGFGTVDLALPYQLSQAYAEPDSRMVDPAKKFWNTFIEFALENHPKLKQIYYAEPESEPDRSD